MAIHTFASIYIGSYEVTLDISEISAKKNIKRIDTVRKRLELGRDAYTKANIGYELVDELCDILAEFKTIIQSYNVNEYEVYASSVIRDASNEHFILDQIRLRTGFEVKVISNSEHRFISYKSIASQEVFESLIATSAAVVDVGGASIQVTIFKEGQLITTQRLEIGIMKIRGLLYRPGITEDKYKYHIQEYLNKRLEVLISLYIPTGVENIVFLNDLGMELIPKIANKNEKLIKSEKFNKYLEKLQKKSTEEIMQELNVSHDLEMIVIPSIYLFMSMVSSLNASMIWIPGMIINDGIAYSYAYDKKLIKPKHDFDADVLSASKYLSRHYNSFSTHIEALSVLSMKIFDALKKSNGLSEREALLLKAAAILHDCGKFVSFADGAECAYNIIMASEIIGLSHNERQMVAYIVLFNSHALAPYEELSDRLEIEEYITVAKLSAILRVANALDQSHRQKFKNVKISLKDKKLVITLESFEDISLEQTLFEDKTSYFENIFSIKPILKEKKVLL